MTDTLLPAIEGEKDGWPVIHYDFGARRRLHGFHQRARRAARAQPVLLEHVRAGRLLDGDALRRGARGVPAPRRVLQRLDRPARSRPGVPVHPDAGEPAGPREVPPGAQQPGSHRRPSSASRPTARRICVADIDRIVGKGSCDFIEDFALLYPTEVFLGILGLPPEDAELFVPLVDRFFVHFYGEDKDPDRRHRRDDPGLLRRGARRPARAPARPVGGLRQLPL